jgi:hypothetical protein
LNEFFEDRLTIQWAFNSQAAALEDVSVYHGGFHVFMAKEFLNGANIIAAL